MALRAIFLNGRRSSVKEEIIISSGRKEGQAPPQQPHLLAEVATTDEEFLQQIELLTER